MIKNTLSVQNQWGLLGLGEARFCSRAGKKNASVCKGTAAGSHSIVKNLGVHLGYVAPQSINAFKVAERSDDMRTWATVVG